jgi:hypothetical protein
VGKLEDWIHIEAIRVITHHASAVLVAIVVFGIIGRLVSHLLPEGRARKIVIVIDDVVLILVLILFAVEMLVYLWGRYLPFIDRPALTHN